MSILPTEKPRLFTKAKSLLILVCSVTFVCNSLHGRTVVVPDGRRVQTAFGRLGISLPTAKDQRIISGVVRDSISRRPLDGVNVMLQTPDGRGIFKYTITKEDGKYELEFPKGRDSLLIVVTGFNIRRQEKLVTVRTQIVDFFVKAEAINIGTVSIKAPDISRRNDTLNYRVESFIDTSDRSIGDVLKKMPGIDGFTRNFLCLSIEISYLCGKKRCLWIRF